MKKRGLLVVSFLSFIILGLPDGMLGVAWPSVSGDFALPLGSLGLLMVGFTVGYVATTALTGTLILRVGYSGVMTTSAAALAAGAATLAFVPWWPGLVVAMLLLGTGSGLLDGGLNAYGATFFRPRDLNWLHAFYGVGAALGPVIMTPLVVSGTGWRGGYGVLTLLSLGITGAFVVTRKEWMVRPPEAQTVSQAGPVDGRMRLVMTGSVALFFLYTGLEVVAGQWAFSLFTIGRSIDATVAGAWVALYWVSLTAGRIIFGWVAERVPVIVILRGAILGAAVGIALLWQRLVPVGAPIGLGILGFSLAPMFPLLIGETPGRVGVHRADHLIGFQIAAANVGAVTMVSLVGLGVEQIGLEIVPVALAAVLVLFTGLHELLLRQTSRAVPALR